MLTRDEALWGQLITLEAKYLDIDSLKKSASQNVLYQPESLDHEIFAFRTFVRLFYYFIMFGSIEYMYA